MIELCVDLASPELSTPCPEPAFTQPPLTFTPPSDLPFTGLDIAALVALALLLISIGLALSFEWRKARR